MNQHTCAQELDLDSAVVLCVHGKLMCDVCDNHDIHCAEELSPIRLTFEEWQPEEWQPDWELGQAVEAAAADEEEEGVLDKAAFLAAGGTEADFALLDVDGDGVIAEEQMKVSQAQPGTRAAAKAAARTFKAIKEKTPVKAAAVQADKAKKPETAAKSDPRGAAAEGMGSSMKSHAVRPADLRIENSCTLPDHLHTKAAQLAQLKKDMRREEKTAQIEQLKNELKQSMSPGGVQQHQPAVRPHGISTQRPVAVPDHRPTAAQTVKATRRKRLDIGCQRSLSVEERKRMEKQALMAAEEEMSRLAAESAAESEERLRADSASSIWNWVGADESIDQSAGGSAPEEIPQQLPSESLLSDDESQSNSWGSMFGGFSWGSPPIQEQLSSSDEAEDTESCATPAEMSPASSPATPTGLSRLRLEVIEPVRAQRTAGLRVECCCALCCLVDSCPVRLPAPHSSVTKCSCRVLYTQDVPVKCCCFHPGCAQYSQYTGSDDLSETSDRQSDG